LGSKRIGRETSKKHAEVMCLTDEKCISGFSETEIKLADNQTDHLYADKT